MKIAVLADIHGNAPALKEVLGDLSRQGVDRIVQLGDAPNGPVDPAGVMNLLRTKEMVHIQGNGERMMVNEDAAERSASARFARERLSPDQLEWIASWPPVYRGEDFFACHGSPDSDMEYLLESVTPEGVRLKSAHAIETNLGDGQSSLVMCAHSHIPRFVRTNRATWVLNPGSVGLPAYSLPSPVPHSMETGSPCARYAIAENVGSGWRVSHIAIPYDFEKAASIADREGFPQWAHLLRTGYAS